MCESKLCMLKHLKKEVDRKHDESDFIIDAVETIRESGVNEEDFVNEDSEDEIDEINVNEKTFNNPAQTVNKPFNVISKQKENFT